MPIKTSIKQAPKNSYIKKVPKQNPLISSLELSVVCKILNVLVSKVYYCYAVDLWYAKFTPLSYKCPQYFQTYLHPILYPVLFKSMIYFGKTVLLTIKYSEYWCTLTPQALCTILSTVNLAYYKSYKLLYVHNALFNIWYDRTYSAFLLMSHR